MKILEILRRNRAVNALVKWSRIDRLIDLCLSRFPLVRTTPNGLQYQISSASSLIVANEIFGMDCYGKAIRAVAPKTFIDLGTNVGYFPVAVAEPLRSQGFKGLCVEPNPSLSDSVRFHITTNRLENVHFRQGAVGLRGASRETDFYINPSHIASSLSNRFNPLLPVVGKTKRITVPMIDLPKEWDSLFPSERINLLKIDIEEKVGYV
jgi:FkbM family methyltransferase